MENDTYQVKKIQKEECQHSERIQCDHGCKTAMQIIEKKSREVVLETCFLSGRRLASNLMTEAIRFEKYLNVQKLKMEEVETATKNLIEYH